MPTCWCWVANCNNVHKMGVLERIEKLKHQFKACVIQNQFSCFQQSFGWRESLIRAFWRTHMEEGHKIHVVLARHLLFISDTNKSFNGVNWDQNATNAMQILLMWWLKVINTYKTNSEVLQIKDIFSHFPHSQFHQGNPDRDAKLPLCYFESYLNVLCIIN